MGVVCWNTLEGIGREAVVTLTFCIIETLVIVHLARDLSKNFLFKVTVVAEKSQTPRRC